MKRDISLLIMGMIMGAIAMNLFLGSRLDDLYISREKLKIELYETKEKLKKTEARWQSHRAQVVREVDIEFVNEPADNYLEVALQEAILEITRDLLGEEVEKVSPMVALRLLDQRIVEVDGKDYRLHVHSLIIAEKLTFLLRYAPVARKDDDEP